MSFIKIHENSFQKNRKFKNVHKKNIHEIMNVHGTKF